MSSEIQLEKIAEVLRYIESLAEIEQPEDAGAAGQIGWTVADTVAAELLSEYDAEQRQNDSCRVIPVRIVLMVMAEMEGELVKRIVLNPGEILVGKITAIFHAGIYVVTHLPEIWDAILDAIEADGIVAFLAEFALQIVAVAALKKMIEVGGVVRDDFTTRMRKKALPQSSGKRYWRKKVARQ